MYNVLDFRNEGEMMEWISVKDRLPEDGQHVLFINSNLEGLPSMGWYEKYIGFLPNGCLANNIVAVVTHWMPLPAPPKMSVKFTPGAALFNDGIVDIRIKDE